MRKRILLTGASGNMGMEGLKQFCALGDLYHIVVFALPTENDRKILRTYEKNDCVSIVWGDLCKYDDVKRAVETVDVVLHVGALVSPMADHNPELAWKVNFGGTKNIVDAILEREDSDEVKLMYTGTVAETGNRVPPYHWGRIGDPLVPSAYDYYALSKIAAERYVIESGLKKWVSLRQTGILHENILNIKGGIAYHQPINNPLEWVTAHDSGRILVNICSDEVPEKFWRNVYNIGGGEKCRLTSFQFTDKVYRMMGVDFRELEDPNWYATRNFHGQWYYDSDKLDAYLNFRTEDVDDVFARIRKKLSLSMKMLRYMPKGWVKEKIMRPRVLKEDTPLAWIKDKDEAKINAFLVSREKWEEIPGWDHFSLMTDPPHKKLDHGYDESKADAELDLKDVQKAADFRGGKCLSGKMKKGDLNTRLKWSCFHGHEFEASPYLVLKTGHWCSECLRPPWNFDEQAKSNPFMAQVWYADHDPGENNEY